MKGQARMVDVAQKPIVERIAQAEGRIHLRAETLAAIRDGRVEKGDVLEVARVAAIQAAKATPQILPLCHPIPLEAIDVEIRLERDAVHATSTIRAHWRTGVEMEALVATSTALLTVWDLVKPLEKDEDGQYPGTRIEGLRVVRKVKKA